MVDKQSHFMVNIVAFLDLFTPFLICWVEFAHPPI